MGWLYTIMHADIIPVRYLNFLYVPAASLAGGFTYAMTGHWPLAIGCQLTLLSFFWLITAPAVWIASAICRFFGWNDPPVQY
jgi:hypothetical protein